jgi:hypothetical protein
MLDQLDLADHVSEAVLQDALAAVLAAEPLVVFRLEPLLTAVVDVGEPEQVTDDLAVRVIAVVFAHGAHAGQAERHDLLRLGGRQMALQVDEVAAEVARDLARERVLVLAGRIRELADAVERVLELARIADDRVDRRADRERLAVAIRQRAAMRGDLDRAQMTIVRLLGEKVLVHEL